MSEDQDFASMLEHDGHAQMRRGFNPGEKVRGTVVAITRNSILLDINAKSEGVLDRSLMEEEDGKLSVKVGDEMDAYVVGADKGEISLTTRLRGQDLESGELRNAFDAQIPVEGKVTGTNTAGLEVTIAGKRGFCPVSQIEIFRVEEKDVYVGQTMTFLILEYDENNLVVSRRTYLQKLQEDQRQQLEEGLREGDNVTGTVRKIADFGVFVELGGADGLIPMGELAWERVEDANTVVKLGDKVTVKVIKLDWPKNRITLSLRQAGSDPWDGIEAKLMVGMSYKGKVTRLADFGAFVQIEPGIEGLLHISKLGAGRRIGHPREVVDAGQELEVYVEGIDTERRRISLSIGKSRPAAAESDAAPAGAVAIGSEVKGSVVEVRPFGVFVKLNERQTGLLHISEIEAAGGGKSAMMRDYQVGKEVTVLVKAYKEDKVSLALPGSHNEDGADYRQYLTDGKQQPSNLGSLGGLFDNLKL